MSVIVVLHNSADAVSGAIRSVPADCELIVVDNDSRDNGVEVVTGIRPDTQVIQMDRNIGFGAGCNAGARGASGETLIFLNPDAVLSAEAVSELVEAVAKEPFLIVGPAFYTGTGSLILNSRRRSRPLQDVLELLPSAERWMPECARRDLPASHSVYRAGGTVAYVQGACFAVRRSTFATVDGFDEDFFLYAEEETLADKVAAVGGRSLYLPSAKVIHAGGTSTSKVAPFAVHHHYRSRILYYAKRDGRLVATTTALCIALAAIIRAGVRSVRAGRAQSYPVIAGFDWLEAVLTGLMSGLRAAFKPRPT